MQNKEKRLFLASHSPRRKALLSQMGHRFDVIPSSIDESRLNGESADTYVNRIAIEKAREGYLHLVSGSVAQEKFENYWVVGGDTAIVLGEEVLGKPKSQSDAVAMLQKLSGKEHIVLSAVAVWSRAGGASKMCVTTVKFKNLDESEIHHYVASGEFEGKAGSYSIQGLGACFVERISGSYSGVMGLPIFELDALLSDTGFKAQCL